MDLFLELHVPQPLRMSADEFLSHTAASMLELVPQIDRIDLVEIHEACNPDEEGTDPTNWIPAAVLAAIRLRLWPKLFLDRRPPAEHSDAISRPDRLQVLIERGAVAKVGLWHPGDLKQPNLDPVVLKQRLRIVKKATPANGRPTSKTHEMAGRDDEPASLPHDWLAEELAAFRQRRYGTPTPGAA